MLPWASACADTRNQPSVKDSRSLCGTQTVLPLWTWGLDTTLTLGEGRRGWWPRAVAAPGHTRSTASPDALGHQRCLDWARGFRKVTPTSWGPTLCAGPAL